MKRMKGALAGEVAHRIAKATAAIFLAALTLPHSSSAQQRDPLAGFDAYVVKGMQDWKIPGLAVGIVKGDAVIYAKGFGVRTLGRPEKVDENTLFAIASDTKSCTGIVLAMLVDEGKVRWDAPVTTYLPWFQLSNDYLTRELTVRRTQGPAAEIPSTMAVRRSVVASPPAKASANSLNHSARSASGTAAMTESPNAQLIKLGS